MGNSSFRTSFSITLVFCSLAVIFSTCGRKKKKQGLMKTFHLTFFRLKVIKKPQNKTSDTQTLSCAAVYLGHQQCGGWTWSPRWTVCMQEFGDFLLPPAGQLDVCRATLLLTDSGRHSCWAELQFSCCTTTVAAEAPDGCSTQLINSQMQLRNCWRSQALVIMQCSDTCLWEPSVRGWGRDKKKRGNKLN